MKRTALPILYSIASLALVATQAEASLLIGTVLPPPSQNDSVTNINELIVTYNNNNDPDLASVIAEVGKTDSGDGFGNVSLDGNFQFYGLSSMGTTGAFEWTFAGESIYLVAIDPEDLFSYDVAAFEWTGPDPVPFDVYVSKNDGGFSAWTYMDGINPLYMDTDGTLDTVFDVWNNGEGGAVEPGNGNEISHFTLYRTFTPDEAEVPEPSSLLLASLGVFGLAGVRSRRRRQRRNEAA